MEHRVKSEELPGIVEQKLAAFAAMREDFEASFRFLQEMHGQRHFEIVSAADAVRYLHARWISERKGRILSIARTTKEYEGGLCLELLQGWQQGDTASVVDFLSRRLDMLPLADITRQMHELDAEQREHGLLERLAHGRLVMLNRGMNLLHVLDALFALSEEELLQAVRDACIQYGHTPEAITQQLQEMDSELYSYVPHKSLAQQNMLVMNVVGTDVLMIPDDIPGERSWRVVEPTEPNSPLAEHVVEGYQELVTPSHNNLNADKFVDRLEPDDSGEVV